jgi:hypothetical protein
MMNVLGDRCGTDHLDVAANCKACAPSLAFGA